MPGVSAGNKRKDPPAKKVESSDEDDSSEEEDVAAKKQSVPKVLSKVPVKPAAKAPVKAVKAKVGYRIKDFFSASLKKLTL